MRALYRSISLVSLVLIGGALSGCGSDVQSKVMCNDDSTCLMMMGTLLEPDANASLFPRCCSSVCVVPSLGCDSGFRYLTVDPNNAPHGGFGNCVMDPMCIPPDMAENKDHTIIPLPDLSQTDGPTAVDGGGTD